MDAIELSILAAATTLFVLVSYILTSAPWMGLYVAAIMISLISLKYRSP